MALSLRGSRQRPGGEARFAFSGQLNSMRNVRTLGPSLWALGELPRTPPLDDAHWPWG
jgi:hypothetical protein